MLLRLLLMTAQLIYVAPPTDSSVIVFCPGVPVANNGRTQLRGVKGAIFEFLSLVGVG